jgi:hypothetical protein
MAIYKSGPPCGLDVIIPDGEGLRTAWGTKVFTQDGYELKDITSIEVMPLTCDSVLEVRITMPLNYFGVAKKLED